MPVASAVTPIALQVQEVPVEVASGGLSTRVCEAWMPAEPRADEKPAEAVTQQGYFLELFAGAGGLTRG